MQLKYSKYTMIYWQSWKQCWAVHLQEYSKWTVDLFQVISCNSKLQFITVKRIQNFAGEAAASKIL